MTISPVLLHGPQAIWAHLDPIQSELRKTQPTTDVLLGLVLLTVRFSFITLCDIVVYAHAHELRLRPKLLPLALSLLGPRTVSYHNLVK